MGERTPDAVEVRDLTKYHGRNRGVESLSFAVPNGGAVAVVTLAGSVITFSRRDVA